MRLRDTHPGFAAVVRAQIVVASVLATLAVAPASRLEVGAYAVHIAVVDTLWPGTVAGAQAMRSWGLLFAAVAVCQMVFYWLPLGAPSDTTRLWRLRVLAFGPAVLAMAGWATAFAVGVATSRVAWSALTYIGWLIVIAESLREPFWQPLRRGHVEAARRALLDSGEFGPSVVPSDRPDDGGG